MTSPFVAEIRIFPFNFAPTGWAFCNGQLLPISQNTALFSLLGTMYGGDGKSNFALPNLEGTAPLQQGQGPGLSDYVQGEMTGTDTVTLLQSEIPAHAHFFMVTTTAGTTESAPNNQLGVGGSGQKGQSYSANLYSPSPPNQMMSFNAIGVAGGNLPHNNMMPYLTLNFCIALQGVFPARP
jgi:microcystin-dependent protein